jgi:hypothetical protein
MQERWMPMRVVRSSEFDRPGAAVAALLFDPRTMCFLLHPLVTVTPLEPPVLPRRWTPGRYRIAMRLFGAIPLGWQDIVVTDVVDDPAAGRWSFRDDGAGALARRWDHRILLEALQDGRSRYTDRIEIDAGPMTAGAWLFAKAVFAWRHRRWRQLLAGP